MRTLVESFALLALLAVAAQAQQDTGRQTRYAANLNIGESYIAITNTGANGAPALGPGLIAGLNSTTGNLCVNVYAIDPNEELISCCSCLVTPDQTVNLRVGLDLTSTSETGVLPTSVTVALVATLAGTGGTGTSCTDSAALVTSVANGMAAWGTTLHATPVAGTYATTATPFTNVTAVAPGVTATNLASLVGRCANIIGNASGHGICTSCLAGASVDPLTITTSQQPSSATVGSSIADQATVSGGFNPTGTVTFNLYVNSTASGTPLFTDTETLSGGTATSASYATTAAGTDYWVATYNGDTNNSSVTSGTASEPVTVSKASPTISTSRQQIGVPVGTSINDKATVSGGFKPSGTVTFNLYNNSTASGTPLFTDTEPLSGGTATSAGYTTTATGIYYWVATYNGDSNNSSVTSGTASEPVAVCNGGCA